MNSLRLTTAKFAAKFNGRNGKALRLPALAAFTALTAELRLGRPTGTGEAQPVFDLLRERRQEIGQHPMAPVLAGRRALVLRGWVIGAGVLGLLLGFTALVSLRHQLVKTEMGQLNQVEAQAASLQAELGKRSKRLAMITDVNRQLSTALSNVRPSSALLSELQLLTPDGVQLLSAEAGENGLVLKGLAQDPMAFARINAMQLELRRSPLLDPLGISLSKLERRSEGPPTSPAPAGMPAATSAGAAPVQFEITGRFADLQALRLEQVLRQLGSSGMARRLQLMQREGLLP